MGRGARASWATESVIDFIPATSQRDFYEALGVPRDADEKKNNDAFGKLALKYDPDRNKDPGAEEKFKGIAEAYEVLSGQKRRAKSDTRGFAGVAGYSAEDLFSFRGATKVVERLQALRSKARQGAIARLPNDSRQPAATLRQFPHGTHRSECGLFTIWNYQCKSPIVTWSPPTP